MCTINPNWLNNNIQFPRLIAELEAAGAFTPNILSKLCVEMDLTEDEIGEIVDRAQMEWERLK
jgi:hypothetical protein